MTKSLKSILMTTGAAAALGLAAACGGENADAPAPAEAAPAEAATDDAAPAPARAADQAAGERYRTEAKTNQDWWPKSLDLSPLRDHSPVSSPYGPDFDYQKEFASLDLAAVKSDIDEVLTTSQDWWPADYGNYGPFFIRMAWHSAGTYRVSDGRGGAGGGQQRFDPLNSWPDNANLDKARRLLWPVKQKYGRALSWADLMVLAGNVALENMGFETYGFAGGRADDWEPELVYWGPEEMLGTADKRFAEDGSLKHGLGASVMGLIYVNPEGPGGSADPIAAAERIRLTFGRMAMNDEETVALIAGGHTFGKMHGAAKAADCIGPEPAAEAIEAQGFGWKNACGTGKGADTITSGFEGAWTQAPTQWTTLYLDNLLNNEWEKAESPGGPTLYVPANGALEGSTPDAHDPSKANTPVMLTTDLSLKMDPAYREISERFLANPDEYQKAFAKAWFKLTHRDMGPRARYVGADAPSEPLIWQDPIPEADYGQIDQGDVATLKAAVLDTDLTVQELVRTAWASASTYRNTDMRGGANGARVRLAPQKDWEANDPAELAKVLTALETVRADFNGAQSDGVKVSMADLIVIGGAAAIEKAAKDAGRDVTVPVAPGRTDATADMTDAESFDVLKPEADAFRNYAAASVEEPAQAMVAKADMLGLTAPEMTVLLGGLRALGANHGGAKHGVFTDKPGTLTNDFFVNLLDMSTAWAPKAGEAHVFEGRDRASGDLKWTATTVDLVYGSNGELRALAEAYAYDGAEEKFVEDFVDAWAKVMRADRFDLEEPKA